MCIVKLMYLYSEVFVQPPTQYFQITTSFSTMFFLYFSKNMVYEIPKSIHSIHKPCPSNGVFLFGHGNSFCQQDATKFVFPMHMVLPFVLQHALGAFIFSRPQHSSQHMLASLVSLSQKCGLVAYIFRNHWPKENFSSMAVGQAVVNITPTFALSFNGSKPVAIPPSFVVKDWLLNCWHIVSEGHQQQPFHVLLGLSRVCCKIAGHQ